MPRAIDPNNSLIGNLRLALGENPDIDTSDLSIDASNGTVKLNGTVNSLFEKATAEKIAKSIPGAKRVENNLVVSPAKNLNDNKIKEKIELALGNLSKEGIQTIGVYEVDHGTAYLTGSSTSLLQSRRAVDVASKIPGVKNVVDETEIIANSDESINNLVSDALSDDRRIDPYSVEIQVNNADVFLEGEVDDEDSVLAAGELAAGISGVKHVVNHLHARVSH